MQKVPFFFSFFFFFYFTTDLMGRYLVLNIGENIQNFGKLYPQEICGELTGKTMLAAANGSKDVSFGALTGQMRYCRIAKCGTGALRNAAVWQWLSRAQCVHGRGRGQRSSLDERGKEGGIQC